MKIIASKKSFATNGDLLENLIITEVFNEDNKLLSKSVLEPMMEAENIKKFHYQNGKLVKEEEFYNNELETSTVSEYHDDGFLLRKKTTLADGTVVAEFERNPETNEGVQTVRDLHNNLTYTKTVLFDSEGKMLKSEEEEGYITSYHYEGDHLRKVEIHEQGRLTLEETYEYDSNGNQVGSLGNDMIEGMITEIKREFGDNNKPVKEIQVRNGEEKLSIDYSYDDHKKLIKKELKSDHEHTVTEYEYVDV